MSDLSEKKMRRCCDEEAVSARREEILETATELFAEHGFSDAITQVLADRLQIGKGTLYRHFPSKRALFLAATDRVMVKLNERVEASIAGVDDGLERVARAIAHTLRFLPRTPSSSSCSSRSEPTSRTGSDRLISSIANARSQRWRQLYRELIAEGRIRPMPVEQITEVISGAIYGTMFINYFTGQAKPSEVQAREIVDVAFNGILTESERRRRRRGSGGAAEVYPRHEAAGASLPTVEGSVRGAK